MHAFFPGYDDRLSLHQLTALDAGPAELIRIAGALGCRRVCLFTHVPERVRHVYPSVGRGNLDEVAGALEAANVELLNLEVFPLESETLPKSFREALEIGARLRAKRATAHVHGATEVEAVRRFAAFAELCGHFGILAGLEFNAFSAVPDLAAAVRIVRSAGAGSIVLDTLHLVRSGGTAAEVHDAADLIGYAQLSDGPLAIEQAMRWREAIGDRMVPGDGEFPLPSLLRALRPDAALEVEAPQKAAMLAGESAFERAERAVAGARRVLRMAYDAAGTG